MHAGLLAVDVPFDAVGKYVTHVWRTVDGRYRIAAKESIETLGGEHATAHDALASQGMRVIAGRGRLGWCTEG